MWAKVWLQLTQPSVKITPSLFSSHKTSLTTKTAGRIAPLGASVPDGKTAKNTLRLLEENVGWGLKDGMEGKVDLGIS